MNKGFHGRSSRGVTLVEMLTVIAMISLLMALGLPSYRYVTNRNRISAEVNGLLGDLQYARLEAVKEGQSVSLCVSSNGATCLASSAWQNGWIVFSDVNGNGQLGAGDTLLKVQSPFGSTDTFNASNNIEWVTFNREGFAVGLPAAGALLTLHASPINSSSTRCLSLTLVGMMTVLPYGGTCL
ncbi:MAG: GspH/FimT family pseudopilin [Steroidobacteraceae bacterium]|jgi:type IV fimbrial biogenesis protein FimT